MVDEEEAATQAQKGQTPDLNEQVLMSTTERDQLKDMMNQTQTTRNRGGGDLNNDNTAHNETAADQLQQPQMTGGDGSQDVIANDNNETVERKESQNDVQEYGRDS